MGLYELKFLLAGTALTFLGFGVFEKRYKLMIVGWALAILALLLPS